MPKKSNRNYWENETPDEVVSGSLILKYFKKAGKLQVVKGYFDAEGKIHPGKVVTIDSDDISISSEAIKLIASFLKDAKSRSE